MQTLYGVDSLNSKKQDPLNLSIGELYQRAQRSLNFQLEQTTALFSYFALIACQVALYAEKDAKNRSGKYIRTQEDLNVDTKIVGNEVVVAIMENTHFKQQVQSGALESKVDEDWVKVLYRALVQTEEYKEYVSVKERIPSQERYIFKFLWTQIMLNNESFNDFLTEDWNNWDDDYELNLILLEHLLKKPTSFNFVKLSSKDKIDFAFELMEVTISKDEVLRELLQPRLKNWDPERVATIDFILLKMGLAEFLYFESIPTKVSINEYIEIGKSYSTLQSGQFINGVLDSALKELTIENKINKIRR
ncbi:MAG TPA: transcription antitermination factor NusB [Chitinophagaceae bacterium]|nr:transcription antitermination factor NusB [Chitinophagaceae bacterium]